jgi:THO complex subunit 1
MIFSILNRETHELKPDQVEWVTSTTEQVYTLLTETPPDGSVFAESVKHILKREEFWNAWKNEGCPAFKRPATEPISETDEGRKTKRSKRRIGDMIRDVQSVGKYYLGK